MAHFPQPQAQRRAPRIRVAEDIPVAIVLDGKRQIQGRLHTLSSTGGLAALPAKLGQGALVEIGLKTRCGSVSALAEMLPAERQHREWAQPFRWIALDDENHSALRHLLNTLRQTP